MRVFLLTHHQMIAHTTLAHFSVSTYPCADLPLPFEATEAKDRTLFDSQWPDLVKSSSNTPRGTAAMQLGPRAADVPMRHESTDSSSSSTHHWIPSSS